MRFSFTFHRAINNQKREKKLARKSPHHIFASPNTFYRIFILNVNKRSNLRKVSIMPYEYKTVRKENMTRHFMLPSKLLGEIKANFCFLGKYVLCCGNLLNREQFLAEFFGDSILRYYIFTSQKIKFSFPANAKNKDQKKFYM